jgi:cytochrome c6
MAIFSRKRKLVLTTVALAFLTSCGESSSAEESVGEVMSGEKIYQQKCVSCHGKEGNLGVSGAADLTTSTKTLQEKIDFIKEGGPNGIMQAYGDKFGGPLNDMQIQKVAEYLETLAN